MSVKTKKQLMPNLSVRSAQNRESAMTTLSRMSDEKLVEHGVNVVRLMEDAYAEYERVCELLALRFPGELAKEEMLTRHGAAVREVKTAYVPREEKMTDARGKLGADFLTYFHEVPQMKIAPEMILNLSAYLGARQGDFYTLTMTHKTTPQVAATIRRGDKDAKILLRYVDVEIEERVKILPAGEKVKVPSVKVGA